MQSYLFLLFSYLIVSAAALSSPPAGAITVGGSSGKYKTLSAALKDTSSLVSGSFTPRSRDGVLTGHPCLGVLRLLRDIHRHGDYYSVGREGVRPDEHTVVLYGE